MATVLIRTVIIYFLFMISIRLMGKRQVGELELSELVTTFMISELVLNPIQDVSIPITYAIIPLIFLLVLEVISSFLVIKLPFVKKMFSGNPSIVIKNGEINQKELKKLRMSVGELLCELRLKGFSDIGDVEYAILEQNGKLSAFGKEESNKDGIAYALITDGNINTSNLKNAKKSEQWLKKYVSKHNLDIKHIFLFTYNENGKINVIMKEK